MLAKTRADVTPMNPKNGAEAGQVSISTLMIVVYFFQKLAGIGQETKQKRQQGRTRECERRKMRNVKCVQAIIAVSCEGWPAIEPLNLIAREASGEGKAGKGGESSRAENRK
mmetsp:Transcript_26679/g.49873  ORF Transcript_26679/g.49873 Transcript_26679/m.49873 type:complete len:112 (+) Transcript_26679:535-870(+)